MGSEVGYSNSTQKISGYKASTPLHYLPTQWFHCYFYYITTTSRYLLLPVNGSDLVEGLDAGRQAAVHAKYLEYLVKYLEYLVCCYVIYLGRTSNLGSPALVLWQ